MLFALCAGALGCNLVPVVVGQEAEVRVVEPLDTAAIRRLRPGDTQRRVALELGEPHSVSLSGRRGETWRYWKFQPAIQVSAQLPASEQEGAWAAIKRFSEVILFVPPRQPRHVPRVVLPAQTWELVIVFDARGELLTSHFDSLKQPLGH